MGATGHRERRQERDRQGVGDTQRARDMRGRTDIGTEMEGTKSWEERQGERQTDKKAGRQKCGRETERHRDMGRRHGETDSHRVIDTATFT